MQTIRKGVAHLRREGFQCTLRKVGRHLQLRRLRLSVRPAPEEAHAFKWRRYVEKRDRISHAYFEEAAAHALIGTDDAVVYQDFFGQSYLPVEQSRLIEQDARRDFLLRPVCWVMEDDRWEDRIAAAGHIRQTPAQARTLCWPQAGGCVVQVSFSAEALPERITGDALRVLVCGTDAAAFDLCVRNDESAFDRILAFSKAFWLRQMQSACDPPACKATIVLCTYKRLDAARAALACMLAQDAQDYEVLVINNAPANREMHAAARSFHDARVRYLDCPYPGLSSARNASLYAARGEILLYVDDDGLMEPDCLRRLLEAFDHHPDMDVIGGQILLKDPERFASVILPGYEALWSQRTASQPSFYEALTEADLPYGCCYGIRREAARRLGGFRVSYGRTGKDFSGGEEMVLSHLAQQSGGKVGIQPQAIVHHDVDPARYTLEHVQKTMRASRMVSHMMKLDLYRPWDGRFLEEKLLLEAAEDQLSALDRCGAAPDDLRRIYAGFEYEAAVSASEAAAEAHAQLKHTPQQEGSSWRHTV